MKQFQRNTENQRSYRKLDTQWLSSVFNIFNRCLMRLADMSAKFIYASVDILIHIFTVLSRYSHRFCGLSISEVQQKRLHSWPFLTKWLTVSFDFWHYDLIMDRTSSSCGFTSSFKVRVDLNFTEWESQSTLCIFAQKLNFQHKSVKKKTTFSTMIQDVS